MPKFPKPQFYEDEGFNNHFSANTGSSGTTKSVFETVEQAEHYMHYCPYPVDFKVIHDDDRNAYRIKFRTGISRTVNTKKKVMRTKNEQIKVLKATNFKANQKLMDKLIRDLETTVNSVKTELDYDGWKSTD